MTSYTTRQAEDGKWLVGLTNLTTGKPIWSETVFDTENEARLFEKEETAAFKERNERFANLMKQPP